VEYGRRWAVEMAYSTFKKVFGEGCRAKTLENIARELAGKVAFYNMLVNARGRMERIGDRQGLSSNSYKLIHKA